MKRAYAGEGDVNKVGIKSAVAKVDKELKNAIEFKEKFVCEFTEEIKSLKISNK